MLNFIEEKIVIVFGVRSISSGSDRVNTAYVVLSCANRFCNLSAWTASRQILLSHCFLNSIKFVLVTFAITHCTSFGISQRSLERFDSLHRRSQSFLELRQFTSEICIVADELFMDLALINQSEFYFSLTKRKQKSVSHVVYGFSGL